MDVIFVFVFKETYTAIVPSGVFRDILARARQH